MPLGPLWLDNEHKLTSSRTRAVMELLRPMLELFLFHCGASGGVPRTCSCRDRRTRPNGGVLCSSSCSDSSTGSMCEYIALAPAVFAALAPVVEFIVPAPAAIAVPALVVKYIAGAVHRASSRSDLCTCASGGEDRTSGGTLASVGSALCIHGQGDLTDKAFALPRNTRSERQAATRVKLLTL